MHLNDLFMKKNNKNMNIDSQGLFTKRVVNGCRNEKHGINY